MPIRHGQVSNDRPRQRRVDLASKPHDLRADRLAHPLAEYFVKSDRDLLGVAERQVARGDRGTKQRCVGTFEQRDGCDGTLHVAQLLRGV